MKYSIKKIIECLIPICFGWVQKGNDGLDRFIDPNDGEEISAHYGASHAAAAFIIWGKITDDIVLYNRGVSLLHSVLKRWDESKTLPGFHNDFNCFAISTVETLVDKEMSSCIRRIVMETSDSNHNTVNWLPMRWAVNKKRTEWTNSNKYDATIKHCKELIEIATNADGGVEDRLPSGLSFNLQYDLATVAVMQYLCVRGERIDLNKRLGFLLNSVAPDGDINYQGRGSNQIFAWGLWVYLLASSNQESELDKALGYLQSRLGLMLENNSMMLNSWAGKEKFLWWDYHYASVYIAHFLLWLILSFKDYQKNPVVPITPNSFETGLHIHRSEDFFVSWFEGRSEYLAEKGPAVACIWTKNDGFLCKGAFAPWHGFFGNKYIYEDVVLKNYCGLLLAKSNKDWNKNRYIHKLFPRFETKAKLTLQPLFCPITVTEKKTCIEISWVNTRESDVIFNVPAVSETVSIEVYADNEKISTCCVECIKNQYGWVYLHQSKIIKSKVVKLIMLK